MVLLVLDGASNLLWATADNSMNNKETIQALRLWTDENNCLPKSIVGDEAFFQEDFLTYYRTRYQGMSLWTKDTMAKQS